MLQRYYQKYLYATGVVVKYYLWPFSDISNLLLSEKQTTVTENIQILKDIYGIWSLAAVVIIFI
jgi:hypothetical protein